MKAFHLILAGLLGTLVHAHEYPLARGINELAVDAVNDQKTKAPYYAESPRPLPIPDVRELARPVALPVVDRRAATAVSPIPASPDAPKPAEAAAQSLRLRSLEMRPDFSVVGPLDFRTLDRPKSNNPLALATSTPAKTLPSWTSLSIDPFMLKVEFIWNKPHGQWMHSLLQQINAAKAAGDTETYKALTAQYAAWAEKYLRRDDPPKLDNIRAR